MLTNATLVYPPVDNIATTPTPIICTQENAQARFDINTTTRVLEGSTDWEQILRNDLALSEDDSPRLISRSTITDKTQCPDATKSCNTSQLGILDIRDTSQTFLTTHDAPQNAKEFLKISKKADFTIRLYSTSRYEN